MAHRTPRFSWYTPYFEEGPSSDPNYKNSSQKKKLYCKKCMQQDAICVLQYDARAVVCGQRADVRSSDMIREWLWLRSIDENLPDIRLAGWIRSATTTICNHIINCTYTNDDDKDLAREKKRSTTSPGSRPRSQQTSAPGPSTIHTDSLPPSLSLHSPSFLVRSSHVNAANSFPQATYPDSQSGSRSASPSPFASASALPHSFHTSNEYDGSDGGYTDASGLSSPSPQHHHPTHLSRHARHPSSSNPRRAFSSSAALDPEWSPRKKQQFLARLARLTVSANLPFSWVDNPEWIALLDEFLPGAPRINRKSLAATHIPNTLKALQEKSMGTMKGQEVTMQLDGWTGENKHHLIAFLAASKDHIFTLGVHDASNERKTAHNLLIQIEKMAETLRTKWLAILAALVGDASGESRKARNDFGKAHPEVVVLDCWAHQVNLMVGDFFKSNAPELGLTEEATDVIAWLRSKTLILALLRETTATVERQSMSVIRAVLTRWTSHYVAFERLLDLRGPLTRIIDIDRARPLQDRLILITSGDAKTRRQTEKMVDVITQQPWFWQALSRVVHQLRPLAIATNITQAAHARLDQVLLTFGYLHIVYTRMISDAESTNGDTTGARAILTSLEKRWSKTDQEVFIATVILHPYYRTRIFGAASRLSVAAILALFYRLWKRFYPMELDAVDPLFDQLGQYLAGSGLYESAEAVLLLRASNPSSKPSHPLQYHQSAEILGMKKSPLFQLATRLFSITTNSASCERLFSVFGLTLTRLRNKLGIQRLTDIAELKMHIRDEYKRSDEKVDRMKRHFGTTSSKTSGGAPTSAPPSSTPTPQPASVVAHETQAVLMNEFRELVEGFERSVDEDDLVDNGDWHERLQGELEPIPIHDLFAMEDEATAWITPFEKSLKLTFQQEAELYELLDLDAAGEDDIEMNVDDFTGDILR